MQLDHLWTPMVPERARRGGAGTRIALAGAPRWSGARRASSALRFRLPRRLGERPAPGPARSVAVAAGDDALALLGATQRRLRDAGLPGGGVDLGGGERAYGQQAAQGG